MIKVSIYSTAVAVGTMLVLSAEGQTVSTGTTAAGEWPAYGLNAGGTRYSALKEINEKNVTDLQVAWTFHTGELENYKGTEALSKAAFEATPIMIDNKLYLSTPSCRVFALDAASGKKIWMFDPEVNLKNDFSEITSRGVSARPAGTTQNKTQAPQIIFIAAIDGRLIAIDAKTGKPVKEFASNGTADLKEGLGKDRGRTYMEILLLLCIRLLAKWPGFSSSP
jgi:quinoprotein glucose dehydrogenase